jgi:hypothetical protein
MKRINSFATLAFACGISAIAAAQQTSAPATAAGAGTDGKVTLTGCVVKGDDGFLLTDAVASATTATTGVSPTADGVTATTKTTTTPGQATMLYWLDGSDDLNAHSGHRIEVTGEIEGDVEAAELTVEREASGVKISAKSGDRKVIAMLPDVPAAVGTSGTAAPGAIADKEDKDKDREVEMNYALRKLDVKSVKMISATCR